MTEGMTGLLKLQRDGRNRRVSRIISPAEKKEDFPFHKSRGVPAIVGLTLRMQDLKEYSGLHVAIKFGEPCEVIGSGTDPETARQEAHAKGIANLPVVFVQAKVFKEMR